MFTGIIEEIGSVKNIQKADRSKRFEINAQLVVEDLKIDQSVAVNGVCLTVVAVGKDFFQADAVEETLLKSTLSDLKSGSPVNLERALRLQDRLGGHLVQGHVDCTAIIKSLIRNTDQNTLVVQIPEEINKYTIAKGSISIDGVSLTIAEKDNNFLTMAIIPHTIKHTIFQFKNPGETVNIEVDFFAKYIEQFLNTS
ncbi:riboflavin synthase, partial [candidate division KSB1 bacterium 4572_119]